MIKSALNPNELKENNAKKVKGNLLLINKSSCNN